MITTYQDIAKLGDVVTSAQPNDWSGEPVIGTVKQVYRDGYRADWWAFIAPTDKAEFLGAILWYRLAELSLHA